MKNFADIANRLKTLYGVNTRVDLCAAMGVATDTYDGWKYRNRIPESRLKLEATKHDISLDWLIHGTGSKHSTADIPAPSILTSEIQRAIANHVAESTPRYGTDPLTTKIAKAFDALDDTAKQALAPQLLNLIKERL